MTFPGEVKIDVGLPGQNCSFIALKVVWTHVGMQVAPVMINDGRVVVVTTFVGDIAMVADGTNVRTNGGSFDARKTGHAGELLT